MIDDIKEVFRTGQNSGNCYLLRPRNDTSYTYCTDRDRKVFFSSTDSHIRVDRTMDEEVKQVLRETADKLGRKFLEADYPDDYLLDRPLNNCTGNWNVRLLAGVEEPVVVPSSLQEAMMAALNADRVTRSNIMSMPIFAPAYDIDNDY